MKSINVLALSCAQRHAAIFETFEGLEVGEAFEFINDHAPIPLYYQFCQRYPEQFSWEYLEQGPEVWRMVIRRTVAGEAITFESDQDLKIQDNLGKAAHEGE